MDITKKYSPEDLYQLEHYLFNLIALTETQEFKVEATIELQKEIYKEMGFVKDAIMSLRAIVLTDQVEHVAWKEKAEGDKSKFLTVYRFSSEKVLYDIFKIKNKQTFLKADWNLKMKEFEGHTWFKSVDGWWFMKYSTFMDKIVKKSDKFNESSLINHVNIKSYEQNT